MLDLHCHILPGLDDGPRTMQESLAVARLLSQDGVTDVIATPHSHRFLRNYREYVRDKVAQLNHALAAEAIAVRVWPGSEIRVSDTQVFRRNYENQLYCHLGDDARFTLLEFPWQAAAYPSDAPKLMHWLAQRGTTAIIAHPERYAYFREGIDNLASRLLHALVEAGACLQVTVDSLSGRCGMEVQQTAQAIVHRYDHVVLATDTHRPTRCPSLTAGYQWVREHEGEAQASNFSAQAMTLLALLHETNRRETSSGV